MISQSNPLMRKKRNAHAPNRPNHLARGYGHSSVRVADLLLILSLKFNP